MKISLPASAPAIVARTLCALSIISWDVAGAGTLSEPHWSGLPIWGAEAAARGYEIPLPFGVGLTAYSARQPVDIHDLQLGRNGNAPVSVTNFLQIDRVDTSQQNVSAKLDVLVFPFLDVYALLGYTKGSTKGLIQVPSEPILGIIEPAVLQLNASFRGPTYGAGVTLQGGFKVNEWRDLTTFAVVDANRTQTKLSFDNDALVAETKPIATVISARLGLHGVLGPSMGAGVWIGAMHQRIQQTVAGSVANTNLQFAVVQSPTNPWNMILGGLIEFGNDFSALIEGGVGDRKSILAAVVYRF